MELPAVCLYGVNHIQADPEPHFGLQIQYPDALEMMSLDLKNIRLAASYLSKAELKFDLVSPVRCCQSTRPSLLPAPAVL